MKNFKIIIVVVILLAVEAAGFIWWINNKYNIDTSITTTQNKEGRKILYWKAPMDPTYISDNPGKSPMGMDLVPVYEDEVETSEEKTSDIAGEYYTCPMHPEVVSKEPGECPICGMTLVKKEVKTEAVVTLTPSVIQKIAVRTANVEKRSLKKVIRTVGRIDYNETKIFNINTKIEGWIERLYVDYTGKVVEKGAPLIDIYSPELVSTQEEYLLALETKESLKSSKFPEISKGVNELINSTKKRLQLWDINDKQIEELEKNKKIKKTMTIYSPVRGIVVDKNVLEGSYVKSQISIFKIADISRVWVYADIYEYELPWIKMGQRAEMTLSYYPGKTFTGYISYIYPYLEENTRTVKVRLEFSNPEWVLKPNMYANVLIESEITKDGTAVPVEAVIRSGERNIVIVDLGEGRFEPRDIQLGAEADGYYQVLDGLVEREKIVTSSQFLIDSESRLKEAISKMLSKRKKDEETGRQEEPSLNQHSEHEHNM